MVNPTCTFMLIIHKSLFFCGINKNAVVVVVVVVVVVA